MTIAFIAGSTNDCFGLAVCCVELRAGEDKGFKLD
jgi:hypothetical protein